MNSKNNLQNIPGIKEKTQQNLQVPNISKDKGQKSKSERDNENRKNKQKQKLQTPLQPIDEVEKEINTTQTLKQKKENLELPTLKHVKQKDESNSINKQRGSKEIPKIRKFCTDLTVYFTQFSEIVEFHGFRYLFEKRSFSEKIIWLILILVSLGCCIYLILAICKIYEDHPIIISFSTKDSPIFEVPFPAVTFCSQPKTVVENFNFVRAHESFRKNETFFNEDQLKYYQYYYVACANSVSKHNNLHERIFDETFSHDYKKLIEEVSPGVDDLFLECRFMGVEHKCSSIFKPVYTNLGICYSFNMLHWNNIYKDNVAHQPGYSKSNGKKNEWSSDTGFANKEEMFTYPRRGFTSGAKNSLLIILRQNKSHVDPICTDGLTEFKLDIHNPVHLPNFARYWIPVPYSTLVMISIEPKLMATTEEVKRISLKKRKCYLEDEKSLKYFRQYSKHNCVFECITQFVFQQCRCVEYYMPREKKTPICGAAKHSCVNNAIGLFHTQNVERSVNNKELCHCMPLCSELQYSFETSVSNWDDWVSYYKNVLHGDNSDDYEMSMVQIYFKKDYFLKLQRTEFYGKADLIADIGGLLNIFLGASVLTVVEFIYIFTLRILCNKFIYGFWAGAVAVDYKFERQD